MNVLVSLAGYALAAGLYLFISLILLASKHAGLQRKVLLSAVFITGIWAGSALIQLHWPFPLAFGFGIESLRNTAWLLVIYVAMAPTLSVKNVIQQRNLRRSVLLLMLLVSTAQFISGFWGAHWGNFFAMTQIAQTIVGLWLLEQLFRSIDGLARKAFKPFCIGLGIIFAYDFAFYADAMLTTGMSFEFWSLRGVVAMVAAPLILLSARRISNGSIRVYVSRDVIYHSSLLLVAGGYLLVMALVGYYIRYAGGEWGSLAQKGFFSLSILLLISLFLSDSLRKKLKVAIAKHFFANKYEYRNEWINFATVLEEQACSPYQIALKSINRPFGCEYACIAVKERSRFVIKATYNVRDDTPEALACINQVADEAIKNQWIVDLNELVQDENSVPFAVNMSALGPIEKFNLLIPLEANDGLQAVILLSAPTSTNEVNWEDRDLMRTISRQLAVYLSMHRSNQALAESQQFDTFNRMSAYLVHDLKNVLAQLTLLAKNGQRHRDKPEFIDDAFETVDAAVLRLSKVVKHLSSKQELKQSLEQFNLIDVLEQVCQRRSVSLPLPVLQVNDSASVTLHCDKERFINVICHLVQNAQDACDDTAQVQLTQQQQGEYCIVQVKDTGCGMDKAFIEQRLFKPFDTTKGNAGMGIGAYDAKRFVEDLGGHIDVSSGIDQGTQFDLYFPIAKQE